MSLTLNKPKLDNLAGDIWKSAERLRGKFKAYEYQGVILPIIVIRRLECVLLKWREDKKTEIRARKPKIADKELEALVKKLEQNPKQSPFSNKTDLTLRKVYEEDPTLLEETFRKYINGFSKNVDDIRPICSSRTTSRPRFISATRSSPMTRTAKSRATSFLKINFTSTSC